MLSMNSKSDLLQHNHSVDIDPSTVDLEQEQSPNLARKMKNKSIHYLKESWRITKTRRFQQEVLRTTMAILVFATITSLMMMAQMASDEWFDTYSKQLALSTTKLQALSTFREVFAIDPLHDRLFLVIPDWSHLRGSLPDLLLSTFIGSFFLFNVVWIHRKRIQFQGLVVLRRFLWIMSCLYLFRMMTFIVTTVPNPIHNCVPKYAKIDNFEAYISLIKDMASGRVSACTDNIYSGHTTLTIVILFSFWMYSGLLVLQIYAILHAACIILAILATRLHYTVDVIIAMFMSAFVFLTFHFLLTVMLDDKLLELENIDTSTGVKRILANERVTLHRVYKKPINKAVWWMDGFDLRLASKSANVDAISDEPVMEEIDPADADVETFEKQDDPISPTVHQV